MRSTCLAIVLIRIRIWAFDWYQNRWPWMTLNCERALILRYFTEFGNDPYFALFHRIRVRCHRKTFLFLSRFQKLLLIVYDNIKRNYGWITVIQYCSVHRLCQFESSSASKIHWLESCCSSQECRTLDRSSKNFTGTGYSENQVQGRSSDI